MILGRFDLSSRPRRARDAERTPELLRMRLPRNFAPFHSMSQVECREVSGGGTFSSANSRQSLHGIQILQLQAFPLHHNLLTKHSLRSLELSILCIRSASRGSKVAQKSSQSLSWSFEAGSGQAGSAFSSIEDCRRSKSVSDL